MPQSLFFLYVRLIISMALWGGTWIAGRLLAQSIPPMTAAFLRFAVATVFLFAMCWRKDGVFPRISPKHIFPILFLGATGVFSYSYFFFSGLQTTAAGRAALIVACIPIAIALVSKVFCKESFGTSRIIGALMALLGVSIVIAHGNPLHLLAGGIRTGDVMILGCVASWTAYSLGGKFVMESMQPLTAVTWSSFAGSLLLFPAAVNEGLFMRMPHMHPADWACICYLGALATALAYTWYYEGILVIGASRAGVFINTVPIFAVIMGFFILSEPLHPSLIAGGTCIFVGVYLTNRIQ